MAEPMGLLVAGMNYSPVGAEEYNAWYDTEHVPERLRVKGFVNAERWLGADDPFISIAAYDLDSPAVLKSPAYTAIAGPNLSPWSKRITGKIIRICRLEAEQIVPGRVAAPANAQGMLMVAMNVAPEADAEFNAWYNEEHVPALGAVPGCLSARRFKTNGGTHTVHRSLSLECARSAGNGCVEKSRGHALDRQNAAAFPRHAAPRAAALCSSS